MSDPDVAEAQKRGSRRGALAVVDHLLGRMSVLLATSLLTAAAVVIAITLNAILGQIGLIDFTWRIFLATTIVTILTGFPIIVYSQFIIRELKTSRRMLRKMTERLAWAFHNAERANEAKSHFLANMSHELRTPLNAIIGFSEIMGSGLFGELGSPKYKEYATDIHASGTHLLELINDILDMSKIEAGRMTLEAQPLDVAEVTEESLRLVSGRADVAKVTIENELPHLPAVNADKRAVKQVLLNLLSNAVKFTPAGGTIHLKGQAGSRFVTISVEDTGIGIPASAMPNIGRPFEQVESQHSKKHKGTGLGLALSRSLVELHGGTLTIESTEGVGTTVSFTLPVA